MVGHDDTFVQVDVGKMFRQFVPALGDDLANVREDHQSVAQIAEQMLPMMHADRDEIRTGGAVVPAGPADVGFALREIDDKNLCRIAATWQRYSPRTPVIRASTGVVFGNQDNSGSVIIAGSRQHGNDSGIVFRSTHIVGRSTHVVGRSKHVIGRSTHASTLRGWGGSQYVFHQRAGGPVQV
jgi:hypothetical protein